MKKVYWKPIKGYEGMYEVSSTGLVKSLERKVGGKYQNQKRIIRERILKMRNNKGYHYVCLSGGQVEKTAKVSRLVAIAFLGDFTKEGKEVAHLDGQSLNDNVENLAWTTHKENESHKVIHGTLATGNRNGKYTKPWATARGEKSGQSKLKLEQVQAIRRSKKPSRFLAKKYGVTHTNILNIKSNKIWRI